MHKHTALFYYKGFVAINFVSSVLDSMAIPIKVVGFISRGRLDSLLGERNWLHQKRDASVPFCIICRKAGSVE